MLWCFDLRVGKEEIGEEQVDDEEGRRKIGGKLEVVACQLTTESRTYNETKACSSTDNTECLGST